MFTDLLVIYSKYFQSKKKKIILSILQKMFEGNNKAKKKTLKKIQPQAEIIHANNRHQNKGKKAKYIE